MQSVLTLDLLNWKFFYFIHLKLELLTEFPVSNNKKKLMKNRIALFDQLDIYHNQFLRHFICSMEDQN